MTDLIILGNGMAGMTAALYAKRANLNFKIVGRSRYDFGQIGEAILVENYPCVPDKNGFDLAVLLYDQLQSIGVEIEEHEVDKVRYKYKLDSDNPKTFLITYKDGTQDEAKAIIYALGADHKKLMCKEEGDITYHYCAICDGAFYEGKNVAVIGGGDSAFTQAEYLSEICRLVYIVMCDQNVTANASIVERVNKIDNISVIKDYPIDKITKYANGKYGLFCTYISSDSYSNSCIQVDGIFVAIGMNPNSAHLDITPWDRNLQTGEIHADETCKTHYPGLFVAGDVREKKLRQSITAAADGANAVHSAIEYLNSLER